MSVARFLIEITINVPFSLFSFFSPPWNVGERQATVIDISHFISCWYISRVKAYRDGQRPRLFYYICAIRVLRRNTGGRSPPSIGHKELGYFQYTRTVYSMAAATLPEIRFIQKMNSSFEICCMRPRGSSACNRCISLVGGYLLSRYK